MEFEQLGNLGKLDLLQGHLIAKQSRSDQDESIELTHEEMDEINEQLSKFRYALSNLNLYKDALEKDQYKAITSIIDELMPYYKDYKKETVS